MSTGSSYITVNGLVIDVIYKDIKNLHIGVYPPLGRVRVAAPQKLTDDHIRHAIIQRLSWIKRQRSQLLNTTRQSKREMISGESHYYWGRRYRLEVNEQASFRQVEVKGSRLILSSLKNDSHETKQLLLNNFYRSELKKEIPSIIKKWEPIIGKKVPKWTVRKMKTKWGSCNRETGHINLNMELAKKHPLSLEYIIVHEMTHMIERNHNHHFTGLMDVFLPDWRSRRDDLNDAPLSHEEWSR